MDPRGNDLWWYEKQAATRGFKRIAGVDEAGRGPLAGPVVAAAVLLPAGFEDGGITDSKKLTPRRRQALCQRINHHASAVGVGIVSAGTIDRINILQASLLAMRMAVANLTLPPDYLLIDGPHRLALPLAQAAIVKADACSVSVAAASIVAKVVRDGLMAFLDKVFPQFGFSRHKGYPTAMHKTAIRTHGCCPIHRRSFKGVQLPAAGDVLPL